MNPTGNLVYADQAAAEAAADRQRFITKDLLSQLRMLNLVLDSLSLDSLIKQYEGRIA